MIGKAVKATRHDNEPPLLSPKELCVSGFAAALGRGTAKIISKENRNTTFDAIMALWGISNENDQRASAEFESGCFDRDLQTFAD